MHGIWLSGMLKYQLFGSVLTRGSGSSSGCFEKYPCQTRISSVAYTSSKIIQKTAIRMKRAPIVAKPLQD
jgi:hypothetical protein